MLRVFSVLLGLLIFSPSYSFASTFELDTVRVIGVSPEAELSKPNSAHVVPVQQIEQQQQTDVNRVLKQVPGVYVQEEDAHGLRPNIGLRGTHPHRSRKIVILEDGILIGPAPYSAPAAYYTPFMSKIESLEIFKGVASVPYGPNSIGGAVNYITRSIPQENTREIDLGTGAFNYNKLRSLMSQSWGEQGQHRIMVDMAHVQTDGFKKIDGGDTSGFKKNDILLKGQHLVNEHLNQEILWKLNYADEDSNETYLGLSLDDFYDNPYRRYSASQNDEMVWDHEQAQLTYKLNPTEKWGTWITLYHHSFHRNWSRVDRFAGAGAPKISDVLANPELVANQIYYGVLTGTQDSNALSDLVLANNNRYFYSQGLTWNNIYFAEGTELQQQIKTQLRVHKDQIKRRHTTSTYSMSSGEMLPTSNMNVVDNSGTNTDTSTAYAASVEDEVSWSIYKLTLAARYESVSYRAVNDITAAKETRTETAFVPGIGLLAQFTPSLSGIAGLNKGITMVGPKNNESNKPEESINSEIGLRFHLPESDFFAEAIYFRADYTNIKGTCSFSSGCASNQLDEEYDGGKALVQGLEGRLAGMVSYQDIYFPLGLNLTLTQARFTEESNSSNPEWGSGVIKSGDPLPYIPVANVSVNIGTQYKDFTQEFILSWTGKMYDQSVESGREEIPAHGIIDWSGRYKLNKEALIYARVDNLLDKEYLVSLRPYGARPGKDRSWQLGFKYSF